MPQAKPIISDDTVAALTGASAWPNTPWTGRGDCGKTPPIASTTTKTQPDVAVATTRKGVARTSDQAMTRRGPYRSAAGPPKNPPAPLAKRYAAAIAPACDSDRPRRVSITGTNVANESDASVRSTTITYSRDNGFAYGRSAANPAFPSWWIGIGGTRVRKNKMTASPGSTSRGVQLSPRYCAAGANSNGPIEKPSVPPVMCTDIARPRWSPPRRCASAAAGGWNAAAPRPPTIRTAASSGTVGATPTRLSTDTATTGPAMTSSRGRQRSATCPNPTCATDAAI